MKITINQTGQVNKYNPIITRKCTTDSRIENSFTGGTEPSVPPSLSLANFPNVSFKMKPDVQFLLNQTSWLRCAYSGREMISPFEVRTIYKKLQKRPNALSANNLLVQYERFMHTIEATVFDIFNNSQYKGKKDYQKILQEMQPEALANLKVKQKDILNGTNFVIETMSEPIKQKITDIRDNTLLKMENGSFTRKAPLEAIKKIKASGSDLEKVIQVYQAWYKLPNSARDIDAFIVKYSKEPHNAIAKRLISTAVATIEHIKPDSQGGEDNLSNYLLVSSRFNNERDTMPLDEYIMLNDDVDIAKNLQRYMDEIIEETHRRKSQFSERSWYPDAIKQAVYAQTNGKLDLSTDALKLTKTQIRENSYCMKLGKKYNVYHK